MANWQTPKTDWSEEDGVLNIDFNRIEENLQYLYDMMPSQATNTITVHVAANGDASTATGSASAPYPNIQQALDSAPKSLGGNDLRIICGAGTYPGFTMRNFSGGTVYISNSTSATMYIDGAVIIDNCDSVAIQGFGALIVYGTFTVTNSILLCTDNANVNNTSGAGFIAQHSKVAFTYSLTVTSSSSTVGLLVDYNSEAFVESFIAMPGTGTGIKADRGGKMAYSSMSNRATVETQAMRGGRILSAQQGVGGL